MKTKAATYCGPRVNVGNRLDKNSNSSSSLLTHLPVRLKSLAHLADLRQLYASALPTVVTTLVRQIAACFVHVVPSAVFINCFIYQFCALNYAFLKQYRMVCVCVYMFYARVCI